MDEMLRKQIKKANLLQELRERAKYYTRPWTADELLDLVLTIREAWVPVDIGIPKGRQF